MKTKIVYVLVSQEVDYYFEMFLLSLYSLRLYHPKDDAEVLLVTDKETFQRVLEKKDPVLQDVVPIVVDIPEQYSQVQRSRYLKTRLRMILPGRFLFLDSDTIICDHLNEIDCVDADVFALPEKIHDGWRDTFQKAQLCDYLECPFFNSGVMFAADTLPAHRLYEEWHSAWKSSARLGVNYDQPALCKANAITGNIIKELPLVWNYSLQKACADVNPKARVFHYFNYMNGTVRQILMQGIKAEGTNSVALQNVAEHPLIIGRAVFSINNKGFNDFLFSKMLDVYVSSPPLFSLFSFLSACLSRTVKNLSKFRHLLLRAHPKKNTK